MYDTAFSKKDWTMLQNLWLAHVTKVARLTCKGSRSLLVWFVGGCMLFGNYLSVGIACY